MRPEAAATLSRWRDALVGLVLGGLGAWWGLTAHGILSWVGWGLLLLGLVLIWTGARRARFHAGRGGPGVVTVDEGAVAWLGPFGGGAVALSELDRLELDPTSDPAVWRLHAPGQAPLDIPVTAEGADALFDAFARLPGLDTPRMLAELRGGAQAPVTIWQKTRPRLH
ncbi:hypothetical protein [Lutimaribacter degradans]|uniref:hypothetical protein n=1 Tax=Lutimaribacter degradans TaxID=2945989 RepID=UPI003336C8D2